MDLFENFDLGVGADPSGHSSPVDPLDPSSDSLAWRTCACAFEPTLNISEDIRIKFQIDAPDNIVAWQHAEGGLTPRTARSARRRSSSQSQPRRTSASTRSPTRSR
jgi:hypothetical protein